MCSSSGTGSLFRRARRAGPVSMRKFFDEMIFGTRSVGGFSQPCGLRTPTGQRVGRCHKREKVVAIVFSVRGDLARPDNGHACSYWCCFLKARPNAHLWFRPLSHVVDHFLL